VCVCVCVCVCVPNIVFTHCCTPLLPGTAETLNTVYPDLTTGGEAIAELLRSPMCKLRTLDLAWNCIRLDSGIELASAMAVNKTLTYLDLSYNGLGTEGECMCLCVCVCVFGMCVCVCVCVCVCMRVSAVVSARRYVKCALRPKYLSSWCTQCSSSLPNLLAGN
jgi:hypothetical protein